MNYSGICRREWLRAAAAGACVLIFALVAQPDEGAKTVRLTIDYGDGSQKVFAELPWQDGMTALDQLLAAGKHPRGIKAIYQGKGATALVTAIDDLKNGTSGRNWVYEVNDKKADRGCGVWPLKAGDAVLWRFDVYR